MKPNLLIKVGSKNKAKLDAVREIILDYAHLAHAGVEGVDVASGVSNQPLSLEETVKGATTRALNAFKDCDLSIGLESGLFKVPQTKSGYLELCACAIYDGKEFHIGLSSAWEFPKKEVFDFVFKEGMDLAQAVIKAGLTSNPNIGAEEGAIGLLTKGRLNRKSYTKEALRTALIHLEP